jgi:hypothetical protein
MAWLHAITPFGAKHQLMKHIPMATNTCNNRRVGGHSILHASHVLSKESLWASLAVYPHTTDRYQLSKDVPAATKKKKLWQVLLSMQSMSEQISYSQLS